MQIKLNKSWKHIKWPLKQVKFFERIAQLVSHVIQQKIQRDATIRMTKLFKQPDVFNEQAIKSFKWPDVFNKRMTKSFELFDVSNEGVTKLFEGTDVSNERVTKLF